jgi:phosphoribosylformylglycinamidine cyclo-ligase
LAQDARRTTALRATGGPGPNASRPATGLTYRDAGVDIAAASAAVERIKDRVAAMGGTGAPIGHFGGMYRLPAGPDRILVASADGIGTKIKLAFLLGGDAHAQVAGDLVHHCVNDVLALGARPLFFLDYVAMGRLDPEALDGLIAGMAEACAANGLALIGGETAEMPGLYAPGEYDVAGFIVGEVAPAAMVDGSAVGEGDRLLGLPSLGLHTNGYSLAHRIIGLSGDRERDLAALNAPLPGGDGETIGEALLRPHRSYLPAVGPLLDRGLVRGMAHVTGGGLLDNVPRMLPAGLVAEVDPGSWTVPPVFAYLVEAGELSAEERYRVFNMGIGFVLAVAPGDEAEVLAALDDAVAIGRIARGNDDDTEDRPFVRGLTDGDRTDV